ncbi:MAG TPA: amidase [Caulobacteraceae bacterium]|jgi:amidase
MSKRSTNLSRREVVGAAAVVTFSPLVSHASAPFDPYLSLRETARHIAARELSPVDLTRDMLSRISAADPTLKSYATVMADSALADAEAATREIAAGRYRGPLHGMPIGIKDLCWTRGVRTMGGLAVRRDFVPREDATVVSRLRQAGAVVLGKLNLSEGAAAGYNPTMDVPLNPWNHDRWPGMSSSGSGVAVAAGLCFGAVGTDTGGSIRMPSSADGVVGLKPTYGRVSRYGVMEMAASLDHVGPMAREVADVATLFDAMAGHDPHDATSLAAPPANAVKALAGGVRGLRIGLDRDYAFRGIDAGEARALEVAFKVLADQGARIVDVRMPDLSDVPRTWSAICGAEMAAAHAQTYPARAAEYGPYLREFLAGGAAVTPEQLAAARGQRAALSARMEDLLADVDAMAGPASDGPAWPITHALQTGPMGPYHQAWSAAQPRSAEFMMPMDLAGVPAICVPCGVSADGLPYSLQLTGRRLNEAMLCRIAYAYEQATDWRKRRPPVQA